MIIASREQANRLIQDDNNLFKRDERNIIPGESNVEVKELRHGKQSGTQNLTDDQRKIIAEEAIVSGKTIEEIAKQYGVSPDSVAAYKNGSTSLATYNKPSESLEKHIHNVKNEITAVAQNKLLSAIREITAEKLGTVKVKDLAAIAKDMSSVVKNMGPENVYNDNRKVILYKPREKQEDDYEIIDVPQ